jgi:thymidylate kinase
VLIAFEGIDGAGKTTTSALVAAKLARWGYPVVEASKRQPGVQGQFAREQLHALAERLWGIPHDARLSSVGDLHWVYLNAAYFAGAHHALTAELGPQGVAIFDNWINKFVARISSSGAYHLDELLTMLSAVPQPDLVFLLDVAPATAVRRKQVVTELERGSLHDSSASFERYQTMVREKLILMAGRFHWTIISPRDRTADEVAEDVAFAVRARLDSRVLAAGPTEAD